MSVTLAPHVEALIREKVAEGPYSTADEVIEQALEALEERDGLQQIRAKLQIGLDQLDRGEVIPFTPEWREERLRVMRRRFEAGEVPSPDVTP